MDEREKLYGYADMTEKAFEKAHWAGEDFRYDENRSRTGIEKHLNE